MFNYWQWIEKYGLSNTHKKAIQLVGSRKMVLELGCSSGYISRELVKRKNIVWGIEKDRVAAQTAKRFVQRLIEGDIEDEKNWKDLEEKPFDVILAMDIIEHLNNPNEVIKKCKKMLKKDGRMIFSIPNIAHWTIRKQLLFGKFDRTEGGILDKTHLHFYTIKSFSYFLEGNGLKVEKKFFMPSNIPWEKWTIKFGRMKPFFNLAKRLLTRKFPGMLSFQIIFVARRK